MGEIAWAACASHTGGMLRHRSAAAHDPELARVYAAWDELRASLAAARPDVLVVIATDHFHSHSYDLMPIFTIGRGDAYRTWGEFGSRQIEIAGHAALSDHLHAGLVAGGFDVAGSVEMRLDHAWACPLEFLDPDNGYAVVPLSITGFIPPLPSMRRCLELGELLGTLLEQQELAPRVAVLATGGISHWIGMPETGTIGEAFDRRFLELLQNGALDELAAFDDETIVEGGGPGAGELRCWMALLGATRATAGRKLVYAPSSRLATGVALVEVARP
jgi:aromatic ring-opening dioxygenase catalytic subunit (LigB family)